MISRCMRLIIFVALSTTLATSQITKEGYVGVNFNAGGGLGGLVSGGGAGNVATTYEKAYSIEGGAGAGAGAAAAAAANVGGAIVKTVEVAVPAPAVHSSIYFEKQVKPVQPLLVEKHIDYQPAPPVVADTVIHKEVFVPQNVYIRKVHRRPAHPRRHYTYIQTNAEVPPPRVGLLTKLLTVGTAPAVEHVPTVVHETEIRKEVVIPQHQTSNTYSTSVNVNKNGQLFNDIFNIPISTLKAVNNLVSNIAGGVSVSKQVSHTVQTAATDVHVPSNGAVNGYVHAEGHVHG